MDTVDDGVPEGATVPSRRYNLRGRCTIPRTIFEIDPTHIEHLKRRAPPTGPPAKRYRKEPPDEPTPTKEPALSAGRTCSFVNVDGCPVLRVTVQSSSITDSSYHCAKHAGSSVKLFDEQEQLDGTFVGCCTMQQRVSRMIDELIYQHMRATRKRNPNGNWRLCLRDKLRVTDKNGNDVPSTVEKPASSVSNGKENLTMNRGPGETTAFTVSNDRDGPTVNRGPDETLGVSFEEEEIVSYCKEKKRNHIFLKPKRAGKIKSLTVNGSDATKNPTKTPVEDLEATTTVEDQGNPKRLKGRSKKQPKNFKTVTCAQKQRKFLAVLNVLPNSTVRSANPVSGTREQPKTIERVVYERNRSMPIIGEDEQITAEENTKFTGFNRKFTVLVSDTIKTVSIRGREETNVRIKPPSSKTGSGPTGADGVKRSLRISTVDGSKFIVHNRKGRKNEARKPPKNDRDKQSTASKKSAKPRKRSAKTAKPKTGDTQPKTRKAGKERSPATVQRRLAKAARLDELIRKRVAELRLTRMLQSGAKPRFRCVSRDKHAELYGTRRRNESQTVNRRTNGKRQGSNENQAGCALQPKSTDVYKYMFDTGTLPGTPKRVKSCAGSDQRFTEIPVRPKSKPVVTKLVTGYHRSSPVNKKPVRHKTETRYQHPSFNTSKSGALHHQSPPDRPEIITDFPLTKLEGTKLVEPCDHFELATPPLWRVVTGSTVNEYFPEINERTFRLLYPNTRWSWSTVEDLQSPSVGYFTDSETVVVEELLALYDGIGGWVKENGRKNPGLSGAIEDYFEYEFTG